VSIGSRRAIAAALALALAACATPHTTGSPIVGSFGGDHIDLVIGPLDSQIHYDCAEGAIFGPVVPRGDGSFVVGGRHTPGHGGPERVGETPTSYPALYRGRKVGDEIIFTVEVEGGNNLGPFTLVRNRESRLTRCL